MTDEKKEELVSTTIWITPEQSAWVEIQIRRRHGNKSRYWRQLIDDERWRQQQGVPPDSLGFLRALREKIDELQALAHRIAQNNNKRKGQH